MAKRLIACIIALSMIFMTACGDSSSTSDSSKTESSSSAETTTTTSQSETETTTTTTTETTTTITTTTQETTTTQASKVERVGIPYYASKIIIANSNAKLAFTTVNNNGANLIADGVEVSKVKTEGKVSVESLKDSTNPILKAVYNSFAELGEPYGYVYIEWDPADDAEECCYAQWSEDSTGTYIGQFPDEITALNWSTVQFGVKQK